MEHCDVTVLGKRGSLPSVWMAFPAFTSVVITDVCFRPCRDTDEVYEAVMEAQKGLPEADERALQLLEDSQAQIKKIVSLHQCRWCTGIKSF